MNENSNNAISEAQQCINRAAIFFDDVLPQIGWVRVRDHENLNELGMLLAKLRSKPGPGGK